MMSNVYIISDVHFGHKNILKYRPEFSTIREHDRTIMENILGTCTKRDTLWMLGDCFFTRDSIEFLRIIRNKVGCVHWILGNHDTDNDERQGIVRQILLEQLVDKVGSLFKYKDAWLSHHPIHPDELRGRFNIHGHVHRQNVPDGRYFNASVENINYTPVIYQNILAGLK